MNVKLIANGKTIDYEISDDEFNRLFKRNGLEKPKAGEEYYVLDFYRNVGTNIIGKRKSDNMIDKIADMLNGREYGDEVTPEIRKMAKENNIVIVYGRSDDLMIFDGAIQDEVGCYEGGAAYVNHDGLFSPEDDFICSDCEYCKYIQIERNKCKIIWAKWCMSNIAWTYLTDIPHQTFNILEDGEIYCRGIVFSLDILGEEAKQ